MVITVIAVITCSLPLRASFAFITAPSLLLKIDWGVQAKQKIKCPQNVGGNIAPP